MGIRLQMWAAHIRKPGPTGNVTAHIDVHRQTLPQRHCNCMVNLLVCIAEAGDLHLQHNAERHIVICCSLIATRDTLCNACQAFSDDQSWPKRHLVASDLLEAAVLLGPVGQADCVVQDVVGPEHATQCWQPPDGGNYGMRCDIEVYQQHFNGAQSMQKHQDGLTHPRSLLLGPPAVQKINIGCPCCYHLVMCTCCCHALTRRTNRRQHSPVMQMMGRFSL